MGELIFFAFWYFLPAGVANTTPVFAAKLPGLRRLDYPLDCNTTFRDRRVFGSHKTWRGIITGVFMGTISAIAIHSFFPEVYSRQPSFEFSPLYLGLLLSFGALAGDAIKSFIKRQIDVQPGKSWFPFDQTDYIIGGLILSSAFIRLSPAEYAAILALWFSLHLASVYLGYLTGIRETKI